jgi:tetratricopeptide (TPR) repeat protein
VLKKMVNLQPDAGDAWNNLGFAQLDKGDFEAARKSFARSCETAPLSADPRFNLGVSLMRAAEKETSTARRDPLLKEALAAFEEAIRLDPANFRAAFNQGVIQNRLGNADASVEAYQRTLSIRPEYPQAHYNLAAVLSARGQLEEALKAWETYVNAGQGDKNEKAFLDNARKEISRLKSLLPPSAQTP